MLGGTYTPEEEAKWVFAALLSVICLFIVFGGTYVPEATTFVLLAWSHSETLLVWEHESVVCTDLGSLVAGGDGGGGRSDNQLFDRGGVDTLSVESRG